MSRANPQVGDVFFMADRPNMVLVIKHIMDGRAWLSDGEQHDAIVAVDELSSSWAYQRPILVRGGVTVKKVADKQAWTLTMNQDDLDEDDMLELAWRILKRFDPDLADLKRGLEQV